MLCYYDVFVFINFDLFLINVYFKGGDLGTKRAKVDQETEQKIDGVSDDVGRVATGLESNLASTSLDNAASTSNISSTAGVEKSNNSSKARAEKSGFDSLPREMREMRIVDEKSNHDEKVKYCYVKLLKP